MTAARREKTRRKNDYAKTSKDKTCRLESLDFARRPSSSLGVARRHLASLGVGRHRLALLGVTRCRSVSLFVAREDTYTNASDHAKTSGTSEDTRRQAKTRHLASIDFAWRRSASLGVTRRRSASTSEDKRRRARTHRLVSLDFSRVPRLRAASLDVAARHGSAVARRRAETCENERRHAKTSEDTPPGVTRLRWASLDGSAL